MASLFSVFSPPSRKGDAWFNVGLVSSFPDITNSSSTSLSELRSCAGQDSAPGCKVFHVPATDSSQAHQVEDDSIFHDEGDFKDQVLVFKYNGKVHAVNNVSYKRYIYTFSYENMVVNVRVAMSTFIISAF